MGGKSLDANRGDFAPRPFGPRMPSSGGVPGPHAPSHEAGGTDPIDLGSVAGEITDAQHGNRAGGALHAVATPDPGGIAGFMSAADKTKLDADDYAGRFEQAAKPTVIQIIDTKWGFWWDTVNLKLWHVRNRAGVMYGVELTPLP